MKSVLEAIVILHGPQDYSKPGWEIPANSWAHAKRIVGAFDRG